MTAYNLMNLTDDTLATPYGILVGGDILQNIVLNDLELYTAVKVGLTPVKAGIGFGNVGPTGATGPAAWAPVEAWQANKNYTNVAPASAVAYNNSTYVCLIPHTSSSTFDGTKWTIVAISTPGATGQTGQQGIQGIPGNIPWGVLTNWAASQNYTSNAPASLVNYNNDIYVCNTSHTSTSTFDSSKFTLALTKGVQGIQGIKGDTGPVPWANLVTWASGQNYTNIAPVSTVSYNGNSYACLTAHTSTGSFDSSKFVMIAAQGIQGIQGNVGPISWGTPSAWAAGQNYTIGPPASVVTYLGSSYVCILTHTSTSTFDPSKFSLIVSKGDPADPSTVDDAVYLALIRG